MTDERGLTYAIIGPTRQQEKEIVWDDHVAQILLLCKQNGIPYKANQADLSVKFPGYGKFVVDGSDNIESLRGKSDWGGIVMDEFRYWKNQEYAWTQVIEPNLLVHKAWALICSTPQGYDYFHTLMKKGDHQNEIEGDAFDSEGKLVTPNKNYISFRFTSYENEYLDKEWIDEKRQTMDVIAFNQEYLARFEKFVGVVYKDFDRKIHVIKPFNLPIGWARYRSMDFGFTNPTVCLWFAIDKDENIYIYDEYYAKEKNIEEHATMIIAKTQSVPIEATWGDPSGEQAIMDYGNYNVYISPAVKIFDGDEPSWVRAGINRVNKLLKLNRISNKPKLFVFPNCVNTIREFEAYRWQEQKDKSLNEKDQPLKADDHCFVAGTKILTKNGLTNIESIKKGDSVWSPFGWNIVYRAGKTGIKTVKDYGVFRATPNHKIFTNRGLVEVDTLRYTDKVLLWQNQKQWSFKEFLTGVILNRNVGVIGFIIQGLLIKSLATKQDFYTEIYGNTIKAKFRKVISYITLIATLLTTALAILSWLLLVNTLKSIIGVFTRATKSILGILIPYQERGTEPKKEESYIEPMARKYGWIRNGLLKNAQSVLKNIKHPSLIGANSVIKIVKQQPLEDAEVYNLATEYGCYFANGVLVGNCMDSLRYFVVSHFSGRIDDIAYL